MLLHICAFLLTFWNVFYAFVLGDDMVCVCPYLCETGCVYSGASVGVHEYHLRGPSLRLAW